MDAHVFRLVALDLAVFMHGGRVEKIHSPAPGLLCLTVFNHGLKRVMVLRHSKVYNHGLAAQGHLHSVRGGEAGGVTPAIYLTGRKLPNPEKPSTLVMTLRKRVQGRRLGAATHDWVNRRVFFFVPQAQAAITGNMGGSPLWLCLDLLNGPSLHYELPDIAEPVWPNWPNSSNEGPDLSPAAHEAAYKDAPDWNDTGLWRAYPVLTPWLRKSLTTLAASDPLEAVALLGDLRLEAEQGRGSLYLYSLSDGSALPEMPATTTTAGAHALQNVPDATSFTPQLLSAWPLPPQLCGEMTLTAKIPVCGLYKDEEFQAAEPEDKPTRSESLKRSDLPKSTELATPDFTALELARQLYEPKILGLSGLGNTPQQERQLAKETAAARQSQKRLQRTLLKLDQEEQRLRALLELRKQAIALQGQLWRFGADERLALVRVPVQTSRGNQASPDKMDNMESRAGAEHHAQSGQERQEWQEGLDVLSGQTDQICEIRLDSLKTVRENMTELFRQSDRGARGLEILAERRYKLTAELSALQEGIAPLVPVAAARKAATGAKSNKADSVSVKSKTTDSVGKLVQRFVSSDGFIILRGRSALGNQAMLKVARPHEVWLHVQGGPSAHVLVRRDNLGVEIPERTLREAAMLSAVKSWRKSDAKAEVIMALARDVRSVKGGAPGSVLVDKLLGSLVVPVNHELEAVLLTEANGENA